MRTHRVVPFLRIYALRHQLVRYETFQMAHSVCALPSSVPTTISITPSDPDYLDEPAT